MTTSDPHGSRTTMLDRLRGCFLGEPKPGTLPGGRSEALRRLYAYDPAAYGRTRNHLTGTVSHLSPYLRHGMLSAVEVKEHLKARFPNDPARLEEFLRQLAWRDFFEKVLAWHGRGLDEDLEEPKHAVARSARIPLDVVKGDTGLPCVDGMLHELFTDGYLHNHARLWFAAYLCHFRGVRWQEGAKLFRQHLYDGDAATGVSLAQYPLTLPPLAEQRRIVAKVEELTARSRAARAALAEVPTLLEQFRQSVLASAFRGDLTADWRAKNPTAEPASVLLDRIRAELFKTRKPGRVSRAAAAEAEVFLHDEDTLPETWRAVRLRDVLTLQPGYAFSSKEFTTQGVRLLRGTNIIPNGTRWDDVVCFSEEKSTSYHEYELREGDIVFAMDRPIISTGIKVARLTKSDLPALLLQRVGRFRLSTGVEPRFLYAYLQSDLFRRHIDTRETGTQLPHVSGNDIEAAPFVLPPLTEQEEIAKFLDAVSTSIDIVNHSLRQAMADLDALDQSILAKAFRGELVPQDPADEPAAALLARIRSGVSATRSVERGRVKFYILLLLRTWNKPLGREMLERGLVLMLNADVRRAILGRSKPAPKRGKKPATPPRFVTGLDLFLGEMLDDGDLVPGSEDGFFAEGQHGFDFAAAPQIDLDAIRETAEAMKVIHKDKLQATDADIVSALHGEIYELVS